MKNCLKWDETYKHFTLHFIRQTPDRLDVEIFRTKNRVPLGFLTRTTYEAARARAEFEVGVLIRGEKRMLRTAVEELERS